MKHFKFWAFLLAMIAGIGLFTSCGKDPEPTSKTSFLVGTWKYQFYEDGYVMWTFKADGTGSYYEWDDDEIDGSDTFIYTLDEEHERIAFYFSDGDKDVVKFTKVSDKRIIVYDFFDDVEEWHKQ